MADYGRYGGTSFAEREGRYREQDRSRSIFPRGRDEPLFGGRDRMRERNYRDNQPGGFGSGRNFTRSDEDLRRFRGRDEERGRSDWSRGDRDRDRGLGRYREEEDYGRDDDREGLAIDETSQLIASNKVEGTPVYGREGERLGTIYNFMVDKYSGQVKYAVMSYGGFLGLGQRYYPLPWRILSYDTVEGGYHIDMDDRDLERAPSFGREDEPRFNRDYGRRVHNWYGLDY